MSSIIMSSENVCIIDKEPLLQQDTDSKEEPIVFGNNIKDIELRKNCLAIQVTLEKFEETFTKIITNIQSTDS